MVDQAVDRRQRHGGIGEDLAPLAERLLRLENGKLLAAEPAAGAEVV
nr:hypothetical protein [Halomonas endophytica]